jgi:hypothetical protein
MTASRASAILLASAAFAVLATNGASPQTMSRPASCAFSPAPVSSDVVDKGMLARERASLKTPAPTAEHLWPHFLRPTKDDFAKQHLASALRGVVSAIVARLPSDERSDARWLSYDGGVAVFEIRQDQLCSGGRGFMASPVINMPDYFVNPTSGEIFITP